MEVVAPLAGGVLIGSSAALLWAGAGRIAGISGIVGGISQRDWGWRLAFVVGLIVAPLLVGAPVVSLSATPAVIVLAGFLVGVGTRLGGGCTSGHGVCGVARLSPRSIAATCVFVAVAAATVFLVRHG